MRHFITSSYTNDWIGIHHGVVYRLDDGSKWRVVDPRCWFGNGYRKMVTITECDGKYRLAVKGERRKFEVVPLVLPRSSPVPMPKLSKADLMAYILADLQQDRQQ